MYRTIVADPPWQPTLGATWESRMRDKAGPQRFYDTLTVEQIVAHKPKIAEQAHVYIWCLTAHVDWGYVVAKAWAAEPITLLTWKKPGLGAGRFRCNTEHILVARVGPRAGNPFGQGGRHAQATDGRCSSGPGGGTARNRGSFTILSRGYHQSRAWRCMHGSHVTDGTYGVWKLTVRPPVSRNPLAARSLRND